MNGSARRLAFADGGQQLLSTGGDRHQGMPITGISELGGAFTKASVLHKTALCLLQVPAVALLMSAGERSFLRVELHIKDHMKFNPNAQILA